MKATNQEEIVKNAQYRVLMYYILTIPFMTLPDIGFIERIRSQDFMSILKNLSETQFLQADILNGASLMLNFVKSTSTMEKSELELQLGLDRTFLYRGVQQGVGPPPPYETVWTPSIDPNTVLLKLTEDYRESEMALSDEARDRLDYIGIELDFLRRLVQQEETMLLIDPDQAQCVVERQAYFFANHIGKWALLYVIDALPMAKTDFYRGHLIMLRGFIDGEKEFFQMVQP